MSSNQTAISVEGLGKKYRLGSTGSYGRLTETLSRLPMRFVNRSQRRPDEFWALSGASFEVPAGDVVGIVGRNGAGKSTLLKILSRVTRPTTGFASLAGRVGSLLEVGTGFHPELTGRENILLSGAILGMVRREIDQRFDAIVDFADIGRFLDTPIKRYSSGMQVRLGFAVAAYLDTEILLVDEVLAVGDADFQRKSESKMISAARGGKTILFVSHNLGAVKNICPRTIYLYNGTIREDGETQNVIDTYLKRAQNSMTLDLERRDDRKGNGEIRVVDAWLEHRGSRSTFMVTGEPGTLIIEFESTGNPTNIDVNVGLFDSTRTGTLFLGSHMAGSTIERVPRKGIFRIDLDKVALLPGTYTANTYITSNGSLNDWIIDAFEIRVEPGDFFGSGRLPSTNYGRVAHEQQWRVLES
jgi:lipopolysaccharide transport system ATP-binding protein